MDEMFGAFGQRVDGRGEVTEAERVRVGEPESPVLPGDINPHNALPYRNGQFAPSLEELSMDAMMAADDAGLLPSNLPIYDASGKVDAGLLKAWEPERHLSDAGFEVDPTLPKYASALILSAQQKLGGMLKGLGLASIRGAQRDESVGGIGTIIIAAKHTSRNRKFVGSLEVYPDFFRFLTIPLAPRISNSATGISVATYAVFHSIGHLIFARLVSDGRLSQVGDVLGKDTWSKRMNTDGYVYGGFLGTQTTRSWRRAAFERFVSELSKNSPGDDFAESFALYVTNPDYLRVAFEGKYEAMKDIVGNYVL